MMSRHRLWVTLTTLLLLTPLVGCGEDEQRKDARPSPVAGAFVGKASGTNAFVSVVAQPPQKGQERRETTVFVCDARRLCEWFTGSLSGRKFEAESEGGGATARGELEGRAVKGTVEQGGETLRFTAERATAAAGLYELKVSPKGELSGTSAAGVALKGESSLPDTGRGTLRLADGKRLRFVVTENATDDPVEVKAGEVRMIVLSDGQLRGAGKARGGGQDGGSDVFLRSTSQ